MRKGFGHHIVQIEILLRVTSSVFAKLNPSVRIFYHSTDGVI